MKTEDIASLSEYWKRITLLGENHQLYSRGSLYLVVVAVVVVIVVISTHRFILQHNARHPIAFFRCGWG